MKNSAEGKGEGEREKDKPQHFYSPLHPFFYDYFSLPSAIFVGLLLDKCTLLTFEKLQSFFRVFLANLHEQINPCEFKYKCLRDFYYNFRFHCVLFLEIKWVK